ncbi:MAG: alpha/beta hydrolase [Rhodospirillaceae bacterium]|nr:alpha/beta hydrolase [Rhodospirillaceae bacterium]
MLTASEAAVFRSRPPWWGGDLQTLRNSLMPAPKPIAGERLYLAMADGSGDRLWALYNSGADPGKPLVILIHGLAGCEESSYIIAAAGFFQSHDYATLRLNLRGAGPSRASCGLQSHAGRSQDLRDAILALPPAAIAHGVVVVGFSLAGNMSLKFAAEYGPDLPVWALATVSAPIDLAVTSANMLRPRNHLYNRRLLRDFSRECLAAGAAVSPAERVAIKAAGNFAELDDSFVAPRNGYRDAHDYWESCQALGFMSQIELPTLMLHAHDDPIVPIGPCLRYPWRGNSHLFPEFSRSGGHVGFHGVGNRLWHLDRVLYFLTQML